jgi:hypothetical protein
MIQDNFMYDKKPRQNSWIYKALLFLSFVWLELYTSSLSFVYSLETGYGNAFSQANLTKDVNLKKLSDIIVLAGKER